MRRILSFMLVLVLVLTPFVAHASPASSLITTTRTGYDSADDVRYITTNVSGRNVVYNWGARGETCVFLSKYVSSYYTDSYNTMASYTGGTSTSNVTSSQMYTKLKTLMTSSHTFYTYYDGNKNVRSFYKYTDCVSNDTSKVALLYRGGLVSSTWDSGNTWNQEHVWPQSKLDSEQQIGDIMHLRPANPSENSSRGNTAYGESSGYYDPGVSVRGDCARTVLYMYVRWGNTLFGKSGVIESLDILLKWIKEDPVDTWEMGRNDSVQSITGVRNVFVDYPELAWLMFGKSVPSDMTTPSGQAKNNGSGGTTVCQHTSTEVRNQKDATCTQSGYTGDTYCRSCGVKVETGSSIAAGHKDSNGNGACDVCGYSFQCDHRREEYRNAKAATCTQTGYTGDVYCEDCGKKLADGTQTPVAGHKDINADGSCDACGFSMQCDHRREITRDAQPATCTQNGYTGDTYCEDCGQKLAMGSQIPAAGHQDSNSDGACDVCGYRGQCEHLNVEIIDAKDATCTQNGYTGDVYCKDCGEKLSIGNEIPTTVHKDLDQNGECDSCARREQCDHRQVEELNKQDATCTQTGYTGDRYCRDCNTLIAVGEILPESHKDSNGDKICDECQASITPSEDPSETPSETPDNNTPAEENDILPIILIIAGIVLAAGAATAAILFIKKKKLADS